jgi:hypothetical protein
MAKIVKLNVMISASTKGMSAGISKAQGMLNKLERSTRKMRASMGSAFNEMASIGTTAFKSLGVAAVGAAAGLAYLTKNSIDAIGDTNDFAKALGLTYNQLRAIQFAAGQAGVDAGALDAAFMKMADTLGTAFGGNEAAIKAFEGIGLSIADLQKMNPAQQFEAIANAINKIQDPSVKMAAARDVFGRSGGTLIALFENSGQAINEAAATLGLFGGQLTQLQVSKVDAAGDAMNTLKVILEGVGTQLSDVVAPWITQVTTDTTVWLEKMGGVGPAVDKAVVSMLESLDSMLNMVEDIETAWLKLGRTITGVGLILKDITGVVTLPFTDIYNAAKGDETEQRLQGIPENKREQARALLEKQGGFASTDIDLRAGLAAENQDYQNRIAEIEKRKMERGTWGEQFGQWRVKAEVNAQNNAEEDVAQERKNTPAVQAAIDQRMAEQRAMYDAQFGSTPGSRVSREREDPALQVLRNIDANTGKNKIAFAGPN